MPNNLLIRRVTLEDIDAIVRLNQELGYPVAIETARERIEHLSQRTDQAIFVASLEGSVVGWIEMENAYHLTVGARAEIGGLIVSGSIRSQGIGQRLIECAEDWARQQGLTNVVVRSGSQRERAHQFYIRKGYTQTKMSAVFTKQL